jgi:hypothetical protein
MGENHMARLIHLAWKVEWVQHKLRCEDCRDSD